MIKNLIQNIELLYNELDNNLKFKLPNIDFIIQYKNKNENEIDYWIKFFNPIISKFPENWLFVLNFLLGNNLNDTLFLIEKLLSNLLNISCESKFVNKFVNYNHNISCYENVYIYENVLFKNLGLNCKINTIIINKNLIYIDSILQNTIYIKKHYGDNFIFYHANLPINIEMIFCNSININSNERLLRYDNDEFVNLKKEIKNYFFKLDLENVFYKLETELNEYLFNYNDNWDLIIYWLSQTINKNVDINYFYQFFGPNIWKFINDNLKYNLSIQDLIIEYAYSKVKTFQFSLLDINKNNLSLKLNIKDRNIILKRTFSDINKFDNNIDNNFINILSLNEELNNEKTYFFYGTNSVHAENILRNGINDRESFFPIFENHYFYLTPHFKKNIELALCKSPHNTKACVLIYEFSLEEVKTYFGNEFHSFDEKPMENGTLKDLILSTKKQSDNKKILEESSKKSCIYASIYDEINNINSKIFSIRNDQEWFDEKLKSIVIFDKYVFNY